MTLTKGYLITHGWRDAYPNVCKDFKDWEGNLYRIGWNPETKVLYMGYGQAPCLIETLFELRTILDAFGFYEEYYNLEAVK